MKQTVLVADSDSTRLDSIKDALILKYGIKRANGLDLLFRAATEDIERHPIDLIVCNASMEHLAVLDQIRRRNQDIPIVLYGRTLNPALSTIGDTPYFEEPLDYDVLVDKVDEMLGAVNNSNI